MKNVANRLAPSHNEGWEIKIELPYILFILTPTFGVCQKIECWLRNKKLQELPHISGSYYPTCHEASMIFNQSNLFTDEVCSWCHIVTYWSSSVNLKRFILGKLEASVINEDQLLAGTRNNSSNLTLFSRIFWNNLHQFYAIVYISALYNSLFILLTLHACKPVSTWCSLFSLDLKYLKHF